jgi:hypothetical protein
MVPYPLPNEFASSLIHRSIRHPPNLTYLWYHSQEGKDSSLYERKYYFHGTNPAVNELIYQQGFNRSFAGPSACARAVQSLTYPRR